MIRSWYNLLLYAMNKMFYSCPSSLIGWEPEDSTSPEMSNFTQGQGNRGIARKRTLLYVAQAIPKIYPPLAD